jgi:beta-glucosidase
MKGEGEESAGDEVAARVAKALAELTLEEKVEMLAGRGFFQAYIDDGMRYNARAYLVGGGNERLGLPALLFTDGPRGVAIGASTCFPAAIARGASFDPELEERVGEAMARELRAQGGNLYGAPCLNVLRHPAWGRAQETYGEDPHHLGEMAAALVRGAQRRGVIATAKHYAANSIENSRFRVDVRIEERPLREVYLPHFRRCVEEGVGAVMSAYNQVNGQYCGHNRVLLRDILKGEWGFEGFVISDFIYGVHGADAVAAGLDVEAPEAIHFGPKLLAAVKAGEVSERDVDDSLRRILETLLRVTANDAGAAYGKEIVACAPHVALACETAERSAVLLVNEGRVLPFDATRIRSLAVIGRLASVASLGDHGSSRVRPPYAVTPLDGIRAHVGDRVAVRFADGGDRDAAVAAARESDAVLVVVGYDHTDEGEFFSAEMVVENPDHRSGEGTMGGDRDALTLSRADEDLVLAVAASNPRCCVTVIAGSAVLMDAWAGRVPAILYTGYAGMEGGTALARLVFGVVAPGGKLPFSIPSRAEHLPFFDKNADAIEYGLYHGYTKLEHDGVEAAYAFGYGLSYTTFAHGLPIVEVGADDLSVAVDVTNTGMRTGDEVVQLYIGFDRSRIDRPRKLLRGFRRVTLAAGERRQVLFRVKREDLAYYDPARGAWVVEDIEYTAYVGSSSRAVDLRSAVFRLLGTGQTGSGK